MDADAIYAAMRAVREIQPKSMTIIMHPNDYRRVRHAIAIGDAKHRKALRNRRLTIQQRIEAIARKRGRHGK